ncbi:MAG: ribonuclease H family protein [Candidatus Heimdallarchaeaceae archaeon]
MKTIDVYTDGSYVDKTDCGGYGVIIHNGNKTTRISRGYTNTTSNRMELIAITMSLKYLKKEIGRCKVRVFSDSRYVVSAAHNGWIESWAHSDWKRARGKELKNKDLWQSFYPFYTFHDVEFYWIEGHKNGTHNMAHFLAYKAAHGNDFIKDRS